MYVEPLLLQLAHHIEADEVAALVLRGTHDEGVRVECRLRALDELLLGRAVGAGTTLYA